MRPECIYATLKIYVPEMLLDHFFDRRISMVTRCPTPTAPGRTHFQICNTKILHCNCDETQNDRKVYMCFFFRKSESRDGDNDRCIETKTDTRTHNTGRQ